MAQEVKNLLTNTGLIPGLERSPGEENGNLSRILAWENPMNRGAWRARVQGGHKDSDTTDD